MAVEDGIYTVAFPSLSAVVVGYSLDTYLVAVKAHVVGFARTWTICQSNGELRVINGRQRDPGLLTLTPM